MLVEFASAVDAVTCAMAVQQAMAGAELADIAFRIGINVGDIIIDGDDIFGDGVNVAARIEDECEPGTVLLSAQAFDQVRNKTAFALDDLGERALKNIDRPIRVYAVRAGMPLASPAFVRREQTASASRQALDRRAAVPEHERRSGAGIFCRRHGRRHHHGAVAVQVAVRDRAQFIVHLQRQGRRHQAGRPRTRRALRA